MVAHFSSKLSHFAPSFRPQQPTFSFTRNAFPPAPPPPGPSAYGSANTLKEGREHQPGAGASGSAGAGSGHKWNAGRASNWGFQPTRLVAQPPASADATSRLNDDEDREQAALRASFHPAPSAPVRRPLASAARRSSTSALLGESTASSLLNADEAGLSAVRLSGLEMQERYRLAFSRGEKTPEVREMELEADEMDLGPRLRSTSPRGRRASVSTTSATRVPLSRSVVGPARALSPARVVARPLQRAVHTRATRASFPLHAIPPSASIPRVRRNSTSAVDRSPSPTESSSPPIADLSQVEFKTIVRERRPSHSSPTDSTYFGVRGRVAKADQPTPEAPEPTEWPSPGHRHNPAAMARHNEMVEANKTSDRSRQLRLLRQYRAAETDWTTDSHNVAIDLVLHSREKQSPITPVLELYNQLFEHPNLRPNLRSYELIIRAFSLKDRENAERIRYLENRIRKKRSAMAALGKWAEGTQLEDFALDEEVKALEILKEEDYFTPAVQIYTALARQADSLHVSAVNTLLGRATNRGRVDVALALFGRLEKSPLQRPVRLSYELLVTMYGKEKDSEGVMAVFEAFLAARQDGLRAEVEGLRRETFTRAASVKHNHSTSASYVTTRFGSDFRTIGDASIWSNAIQALFECGDTAAAVGLLDRLLAAQAAPESLPEGFPAETSFALLNSVVRGFVHAGDFESAQRWFDKATDSELKVLPKRDFYQTIVYRALEREEYHSSAPFVAQVYSALLARAGPDYLVSMAEFVSVADYLLVVFQKSSDKPARNAILDDLGELRATFTAAVQNGFHDSGFGPNDPFSTGFLTRLICAYGSEGRYDEAVALVHERNVAVERVQSSQHSREKWALRGTSGLSAVLGYEPILGDSGRIVDCVPIVGLARPALRHSIPVAAAARALVEPIGWYIHSSLDLAVVESYLVERAAAQGDWTKLALSADDWFQVIRSFGAVAAMQARGVVPITFDFPGFEPIVDDFYASGVTFAEGNSNDYGSLAKALRNAGYAKDRITAVVSVLDPWMARAIENGTADQRRVELESIAAASKAAAAAATTAASETGAAPLSQAESAVSEVESVADTVAPSSGFQSSPSVATLATPPPSPPASYTRELPGTPAPAHQIAPRITRRIEDLLHENKSTDAYTLAVTEAEQHGRFAHPEELGRLIDVLGREGGKLEEVRRVYLVAYDALGAMTDGLEAQSRAWAQLEDRMIVALAQAGELDAVAVHRLRLLHAGMAPSADAYAAMILNMKETTNDAAVALALFEESQQHGVAANVYLFNTLISKLSRARRSTEALEYFELMKESGLRPTSITYGAVINACCKTGNDVVAEMLFKEMASAPGFKPRVPPYNTMIQFYTQTKPDRARALFFYDAMVKARVQPTGHTYKLLLDAYGAVGTPDAPSMSDCFDQLLRDRSVTVTGAHWAALINSWGCVSKDLDRARSIFDSIAAHPSTVKSGGHLPDAVVYEALLNACIANGQSDLCDSYLADMQSKGIHVTAYVANTIIKAHIAQGDIAAARAFFELMQDPPVGVAAPGNHERRYPKHHHQAGQTIAPATDDPIYREPSTWEIMVRSEIEAGEMGRAASLLSRVEERAFPEGVVNRIRKLLTEHGLESSPAPSTPSSSTSSVPPTLPSS